MDDSGLRLRSIRLKPGITLDGLSNAITGMGTTMDPRTRNSYTTTSLTQYQIGAAYRGSGLMRKIINIPALDMVREWRDWKAEEEQITAIEAEETRHLIRQKISQVEILRGLGGGALILGLPGDPAMLAPATVGAKGLAFIHVVSRWQLQFDAVQDDSRLPGYGEPVEYRMETTAGTIKLHPSRVIPFRGEPIPPLFGVQNFVEDFWGESRLAAVLDAVQDCDTARSSFAHLINKARNLRVGIPGLSDLVQTTAGEATFQRRMQTFLLAEGIFNATVYDAGDGTEGSGEQIEDATYKFEGIKDVMNAFAEWVCAVSDIPATRLLGRAPEGMNSSGESQQEDWRKKVRAMQTLDLAPLLERLDAYLVPSALGLRPPEVWYEFAPLDTPDQKEVADRFKIQMEAVEKLQNTGAIPDEALAKGIQSLMIDEGYLPGLEQALNEIPEEERYGIEQEPEPVENALPVGDAAPRTLYVSRKLLNAAEIIRWAKGQGIESTLPAEDMHVTVAFSRVAVDWMEIGRDWSGDEKGRYTVAPGGPRLLDRLGEGGEAVVLLFDDDHLKWRHQRMIEVGASWDWPNYQPHVTITYQGAALDLEKLEPYQGPLVFGPEIFAEVDEGWKDKIEEA
jgi:phage-related protein (TIGR01555 family)